MESKGKVSIRARVIEAQSNTHGGRDINAEMTLREKEAG